LLHAETYQQKQTFSLIVTGDLTEQSDLYRSPKQL